MVAEVGVTEAAFHFDDPSAHYPDNDSEDNSRLDQENDGIEHGDSSCPVVSRCPPWTYYRLIAGINQ